MGKRTMKTMLLVLIPLLILLCGTTFALMFRQTETLDNQFEAAEVTCSVAETVENNTKTSIAVRNTGNIDAYLRVRLVSYWVDSNGNIVSKPSQMPTVTVANGWIPGPDNTYYYPSPIAPEDAAPQNITPNLLGAGLPMVQDENGYLQVIEVFADAIQSEPRQAVTQSWGVTLNGSQITAVP